MNLLTEFKRGLEGKNIGLDTGIPPLNKVINGIQRRSIYGIAAPPKAGKSTLVDFAFLLSPYLKNPEANIKWIYFSFEVDRVSKEFKFVSFFMFHDYGIAEFEHQGQIYGMCSDYLMGVMVDINDKPIPVQAKHIDLVHKIYQDRIIPLFGEYDEKGKKLKEGRIDFIEEKDNPTGMRNYLMRYADANGSFIKESYQTSENGLTSSKTRITGYKPNDPDAYLIVITDHLRKLRIERNFNLKQNMDKWVEYQVELRNWCHYVFVDIVHLNRGLASIDRLKYNPEYVYPTGDDIKDSGNLEEDADFLLTMFNPNDDKYGIKKHFGLQLQSPSGGLYYPHYRSIHLVDSRRTEAPKHLRVNMFGGLNLFEPIANVPARIE